MATPQIVIHDAITGQTVIRDFYETELELFEANQAQTKKDTAAKLKAEKAIADQRRIILDRLGLTTDEFNALIA
jgi:hypothetical protein